MTGGDSSVGKKIFITGLTFLLALRPFLLALGLGASSVFELVGAVLMVIGCILIWMDK